MGFTEDAGLQPEAGVAVGGSIFGGAFGGLQSSRQRANCDPCAGNDECNFDMCCSTAASPRACLAWATAASACTTCAAAVDYTIGVGCDDGQNHYAVCNRGGAASTTGILSVGFRTGSLDRCTREGNPCVPHVVDNGTGSEKGTCLIDLSVRPLASNACIDLNIDAPGPGITCSGINAGGSRDAFVNQGLAPLHECQPCNNWSATTHDACVTYPPPLPGPLTVTYDYAATCPPGFHTRWNQFSYDFVTPNVSSIVVDIRTAPKLVDGGVGPYTPPITLANVPSPDPAVCPMAPPPAGCPKDLKVLLALPAGTNENLRLSFTLTSTSAIPRANSWLINFDCIPSE